ncbi:MAG: pilus assembly protein TadG-related protein [Acidobacteriota bacterium]
MKHALGSVVLRLTSPFVRRWRAGQRGAVLVHVAFAMIGLMAFSALVLDYGVLWAARRQAQNSADAAAMAGAVSMAFVDINDQPLARQSALNVAAQNFIWGVAPDVTPADVTFPACPPGSPGAGTNACIKVDVFRTRYQRAGGIPLPTFFGNLVGVTEQGVRATATAQVLYGDSTDCVKPWAVADKWLEVHTPPWDAADTFERYIQNGKNKGKLLDPADLYIPPIGVRVPDPFPSERAALPPAQQPYGTGFTPDSLANGGDYGRQYVLKPGNPSQSIAPGWFFPVVIDPACGPGGNCYRNAISGCSSQIWSPGDMVPVEPGNMIGPTAQGVNDLIAQDPGASWDPSANGGKGAIAGGCMAAGTCGISPRLVAIPIFDVDFYDSGRASGRQDILITKILGFFIEGMKGQDVIGRLMTYPTQAYSGTSQTPATSFLISIALVR